jgi:hypothetical protein
MAYTYKHDKGESQTMKKQDRAWELHIIFDYIIPRKKPQDRVIDVNTCQPEDNMQDYYNMDVDIIVVHNYEDGSFDVKTGEIKADYQMHKTGNLFIEYAQEHPAPDEAPQNKTLYQIYYPVEPYTSAGWLNFSKADYLLYIDTVNEVMYKIPFQPLKQHILANPNKFNTGKAYDYRKYETVISHGYLIKIDYILKHIEGCQVFMNIGRPAGY